MQKNEVLAIGAKMDYLLYQVEKDLSEESYNWLVVRVENFVNGMLREVEEEGEDGNSDS